MKNLATPPAIYATWADYLRKDQISGYQIDQKFVERGFIGVQAEIDFRRSVYGLGTYDADIEAHSSEEAFQRYRIIEGEVLARLRVASRLTGSERETMWDEVLDDQRLPSFLKSTALRTLNKERYEALLLRHLPPMREALRKEQAALCTLFPEPAIPLRETEMVELRKETLNAVMSDAYGLLGFEVLNRKKNVNTYVKALTDDQAIYIEPDITAIQQKYANVPRPNTVYWPLMSYDKLCYLGSQKAKDRRQNILLAAGKICVAHGRTSAYDDTSSLEVMIRADALWYELTLAPFEQAVIDFSRTLN